METNKNQVVALQSGAGAPSGRPYKDGTALGRFNNALFSPTMQMYISDVLRGRSSQFINNVANIVSSNETLAGCEPKGVIFAALKAAELGFSVNNTMGHAYVIPYHEKKTNQTVAQLQIGYKGFVQLALRSGAYQTINVCDVKAGELVKIDYQKDAFHFDWKLPEVREGLQTVGYTAYFRMQNGFEKQTYWSVEQVRAHALAHSQSYKKGNSIFWTSHFDSMAKKTVLKMLLSKWGLLSVDLQVAVAFDQAAVSNGQPVYIDSQPEQSTNKASAVAAIAGAFGNNAVESEIDAVSSDTEEDEDWEPTNAELDRLFAGEQNVFESGQLD